MSNSTVHKIKAKYGDIVFLEFEDWNMDISCEESHLELTASCSKAQTLIGDGDDFPTEGGEYRQTINIDIYEED